MVLMTIVAAAPIRAEASHKSEMISQLLFGEICDALPSDAPGGDFIRVRCRHDGYEGWCQRKQLMSLPSDTYPYEPVPVCSRDVTALVNEIPVTLSPGSMRLDADSPEGISTGAYRIRLEGPNGAAPDEFSSPGEAVLHYARLFLGTPYLWGGRGSFGIDCSGLTQVVFALAGYRLPRDSGPQSQLGEVVSFLQEARPGDLAFFDNDEGRIVHVGILLNDHQILHAAASVRIDPIDPFGIVHAEERDRTHKLRVIKRFF